MTNIQSIVKILFDYVKFNSYVTTFYIVIKCVYLFVFFLWNPCTFQTVLNQSAHSSYNAGLI